MLVDELNVTNFGSALAPFYTGVKVLVSTQGIVAAHRLIAGVVNFEEAITVEGVITSVPVEGTSVKFTVLVFLLAGVSQRIYVQSHVAKFTTTVKGT